MRDQEKIGIGDVSIIYAYEQYRETVPVVGIIMIWSTDVHLKSYRDGQFIGVFRNGQQEDN